MKKYSRICADISLDAVDHNLDVMQARLKPGVKICAVIKANGYGHGAVQLAQHIEKREEIWGFACA
ncbi:MAG: alanine racemase, partial [Lachnospiraceae bacterium]|nr:alanine racemase [Lachnospiraceae bacterium]